MAANNFDKALPLVLKHEGGYVDDPHDPGGATNLGVTIGTLSLWLGRAATKAEVRALTVALVAPIYRQRYWDVVKGDNLPGGLDYALFDYAVNSGPKRAVIALQRIVGVADDGKLGPVTLNALDGKNAHTLLSAVCDERMAFLGKLSTWPRFGKGWTTRVRGVEAAAIKMVGVATPAVCPACKRPVV